MIRLLAVATVLAVVLALAAALAEVAVDRMDLLPWDDLR